MTKKAEKIKLAPIDPSKEIDFSGFVRTSITAYRKHPVRKHEGTTGGDILNAVYQLDDNQKQLLRTYLVTRYNHVGANGNFTKVPGHSLSPFLNSLPENKRPLFRNFFAVTLQHMQSNSTWNNYSDSYLNLMFTFGLAKGDGSHPVMDIEICEAFGQHHIAQHQKEKIAQEKMIAHTEEEIIQHDLDNSLGDDLIGTQEPSGDIDMLHQDAVCESSSIDSSIRIPTSLSFFSNATKRIKDNLQEQKNEQAINDHQNKTETTSTQVIELYIVTKIAITLTTIADSNHTLRQFACDTTSQLLGVNVSEKETTVNFAPH